MLLTQRRIILEVFALFCSKGATQSSGHICSVLENLWFESLPKTIWVHEDEVPFFSSPAQRILGYSLKQVTAASSLSFQAYYSLLYLTIGSHTLHQNLRR